MGKKRKASSRIAQPKGPGEVNASDARLGPINSYEDVANSEEEHFLNQDKIMFDDGPHTKRRRGVEEEDKFLEQSEEEVLDVDDDSEEEEEPVPKKSRAQPRKSAAAQGGDSDDDRQGASQGQDEDGDGGWWGDSKTDYYDADQLETEADALEEEAEAKRLQQQKLSKMAEEDFLFDEADWLASKPDDDEEKDVVTEVLKDIEVTDDMTADDRTELLQSRYPEFEHLVSDFQVLQPQLETLQKEANGKSGKSIEAVKYWVLGCYVAALASYFAILTSPSRDGSTTQKIMGPSELRDHEVMETLVMCRQAWQRISDAKAAATVMPPEDSDEAMDDGMIAAPVAHYTALSKEEKKRKKAKDKAKDKTKKAKENQARAVDESLADIDGMLKDPSSKKIKRSVSSKRKTDQDDDSNSDFGEEEALDARTAADKAARKKSLRFYTSQIVQKANRRAGAGRDAGGDMDIPHRERLRDRQARLNAEAVRRGHKDSKYGADLGDDDASGDDDGTNAARGADADDEYYDMVAAGARKKKEDKAALHEALAAASKADRVVEQEEVGEDGKRKITYAIEKNKGLAPRRKKEDRNPRVKKKKQYEAKQKKLKSMKPTWKGGEPRGGYGGEMTGITTGLVRARKL